MESPSDPALAHALAAHKEQFAARFGDARGVRLFFSPGRVNLMGAHLDYNGGPVMPATIDRGTFLALRPRAARSVHFASTVEPGELAADLDDLPRTPRAQWTDYPLGVLLRVLERARPEHGLQVLFGGNLPIGAGLSSSASICVGLAFALERVWGLEGSLADCIDAALWGEREFVGVRCGIMDPYAVAHGRAGHLLWLDCKDASIDHVPLPAERLLVAVADSGVRRGLAQGAFNQRVSECAQAFELLRPFAAGAECLRDVSREVVREHADRLPETLQRRARHVVSEVARTFDARDALRRGDLERFGAQVSAAHASLRELFEVSIPELDVLVDAAQEWPGVLGARLTGAGFGGCVAVVLRREAREGFQEHVERAFQARFRRRPTVEFFVTGGGPREL